METQGFKSAPIPNLLSELRKNQSSLYHMKTNIEREIKIINKKIVKNSF